MVQVPVGNPLRITLPVGFVQIGCVTVPIPGAEGVIGAVFIIAVLLEEVHWLASLTVKV